MLADSLSWLGHFFYTFPYKDAIEILFFSTVIYYILLWLRKDTEKNMLGAFYVYSILFFIAHYADLQVVRFILFISAPILALIFIIMHQETLQKNFVNLTRKTSLKIETSNWLDELMKCCLMALNRHREILIVIERNDQLKSLIHAPYFIYAELKKDVFDILLEKHNAGNDYMLWINQAGKLVAINCTWHTQIDETWISKEAQHIHPWKQQALFFTSKTDALVCKVNPLTRSFDIVSSGAVIEQITAEQVASFLKKNLLTVRGAQKEKATAVSPQSPDSSTNVSRPLH